MELSQSCTVPLSLSDFHCLFLLQNQSLKIHLGKTNGKNTSRTSATEEVGGTNALYWKQSGNSLATGSSPERQIEKDLTCFSIYAFLQR